jgi:hypothetical protein
LRVRRQGELCEPQRGGAGGALCVGQSDDVSLPALRVVAFDEQTENNPMRRAAKVDSNHARIVATLRAVGAHVINVSAVPGCLDILVGFRGQLVLMEVKDGDKPPSARRLTEAEAATINALARAGVIAPVVCNEVEALRAIGAMEAA